MRILLAVLAIALASCEVLLAADIEPYAKFDPSAPDSEWWLRGLPAASVRIDGKIKDGDLEKLMRALGNHEYEANRWSIALNSAGGDVREAMQIGRLLRRGLFEAFVDQNSHCASACFLIWVASVDRSATPGRLGVHRPFYDKQSFASLSAENAAEAYKKVDRTVRVYLMEMGVPIKWIDKMFSISSGDVYWLSQSEILELSAATPFYDEWLRAKCPNGLSEEESSNRMSRSGSQSHQDFLENKWEKHRECLQTALYDARSEVRGLIEHAAGNETNR